MAATAPRAGDKDPESENKSTIQEDANDEDNPGGSEAPPGANE